MRLILNKIFNKIHLTLIILDAERSEEFIGYTMMRVLFFIFYVCVHFRVEGVLKS